MPTVIPRGILLAGMSRPALGGPGKRITSDRSVHPITEGAKAVLKSLLFLAIAFMIATLPATWLLMLFFGNIGMELSYWGTFPLGILVSVLLAGVTSYRY